MKHVIVYEGLTSIAFAVMQEEYAEQFAPWINEWHGVNGTTLRPPYSVQSGKEWIRSLDKEKGRNEVFAVLKREPQRKRQRYTFIGHTGLHGITWPEGFAITGSVLGPLGQGKGYGTEAKLLLLYHAFRVLGLRKVTSSVKGWNAQSLGHLVKCGYRICGRFRKQRYSRGEYVDEILLETFREDWEPIWEEYQRTRTLPRLTPEQRALVQKETAA